MSDANVKSSKNPKRVRTRRDVVTERLGEAPPALVEDDAAGQPTQLFAGIPGLERVKVYRTDERTKRRVFHGNLSVEEATEDRVGELFGGGHYRLSATRRDGQGSEVFATSVTVDIPGPYKPPMGNLPGLTVPVAAPAAATGPGYDSPLVGRIPPGVDVKTFLDQVVMAKGLDALESRPTAPGTDLTPMVAMMTGVLETMAEMVKAISQPREAVRDPLVDRILQRLDQLGETPKTPMGETVSALRDLLKLKDQLSGKEAPEQEENDPMFRLAERALGVLSANRPGAPGAPAPAAESGVAVPANVPPWVLMLREYQARLMHAATTGDDPEFIAEMVARYIPDQYRGALLELVQQPNAAALVAQVVPTLQHYGTWLDQLVEALRVEVLGNVTTEGGEEEGAE